MGLSLRHVDSSKAGWDDSRALDLHGKIAVYVNAFRP